VDAWSAQQPSRLNGPALYLRGSKLPIDSRPARDPKPNKPGPGSAQRTRKPKESVSTDRHIFILDRSPSIAVEHETFLCTVPGKFPRPTVDPIPAIRALAHRSGIRSSVFGTLGVHIFGRGQVGLMRETDSRVLDPFRSVESVGGFFFLLCSGC
jgi:hypothetical protein